MTNNKYWIFLEKLRRSGQTNMFGAIPYLVKEFGCTYDEASEILVNWMANYKQSDYKGMFDNVSA